MCSTQLSAPVTASVSQLDTQVSNAVNIRRITIAVILGVFLTAGTTMMILLTGLDILTRSGEQTLLQVWVFLAMSILFVGMLVIIFDKHLTKRNEWLSNIK